MMALTEDMVIDIFVQISEISWNCEEIIHIYFR
jgi:hypothetical protein